MASLANGQARAPYELERAKLAWLAVACGLVFAALTLAGDTCSAAGRTGTCCSAMSPRAKSAGSTTRATAGNSPLFATSAYHTPEGSSMVLSDSLPLFALPAKLIYRIAWPAGSMPPIYTGLWVALCLVLQAVAASRVLRAVGVDDGRAHLAGIVLFCYLPIVFLRFGQAALMGQFVILFALEGYLRAKRTGLTPRQWIGLCALAPLVLLIHPYLAAMCGALVAATILDQWRDRRTASAACCCVFAASAPARCW